MTPAMAAGVSKRLWELGDVVDVLKAWEASEARKESPDQNGRRSRLNERKASSSGLCGCPWLRTACFVGLLGFSTAGVSEGSDARAANAAATGEVGSRDVASIDGCSPPPTASRRIGAPSLLGTSTAGDRGTTAEGAAAGAIASTTLSGIALLTAAWPVVTGSRKY
jgi:hypothetical protein